MSALKWERDSRSAYTSVGRISVSAYADGGFDAHYACDGGGHSLDEAIDFSDAKLREMHDDLREHFAPVLRWERTMHEYMRDARLGRWRLEATDGVWCVSLYEAGSDSRRVFLASGIGAGPEANHLEENQRAAEEALRALGVVFRVEGKR